MTGTTINGRWYNVKPQTNPKTITRKRPTLRLASNGAWQLARWAEAMGISADEAWQRYWSQPDTDPDTGWRRARVARMNGGFRGTGYGTEYVHHSH